MIHGFCKNLAYVVLVLFFRLRVLGRAHIPARGGFILAGNHVSYLDPLVFGAGSPRALFYMARDTLFRKPLFGWFLRKIHAFPLKRNAADFEAIRKGLKHLDAGHGLLIFPEGTRADSEATGRPFAGVGFLARKANVPVVPAYVSGTKEAMPKGTKKIHLVRVCVHYGTPIPPPSGQGSDADAVFAQKVMEAIAVLKDSL
jgi:1-acyl-sn-glycerol-3-phosphate acyltransferase